MIIDIHAHPVLYSAINENPERLAFRKERFGLYKSGKAPMELIFSVLDHAGVDRCVILAEDFSYEDKEPLVSNEEIRTLVELAPDRFIGFASVDPRNPGAARELEAAFAQMGLAGLKLNLSRLKLAPGDKRLKDLYEICLRYNRPVLFHAGMSWEPDTPSSYSRPILFEEVAEEFPDLRFCLAHLGWPWVDETVMLLLKYRNVFTDTATAFMGSPTDYYRQIFTVHMDLGWLQNNIASKVMYGSNYPRFRQERIRKGLERLPIREDVKKAILGGNAEVFLGWKEGRYD